MCYNGQEIEQGDRDKDNEEVRYNSPFEGKGKRKFAGTPAPRTKRFGIIPKNKVLSESVPF